MPERSSGAEIVEPNGDRIARRERSLDLLQREGLLLASPLPLPSDLHRRRSPREVLQRATAVALVAARARGLSFEAVRAELERLGARPWLERSEVSFLRRSRLPKKAEARAAWRVEAAHCLLWALGHVKQLGRSHPTRQPRLAVGLLSKSTFDELVARSALRPQTELLDAADLAECALAALRDARRLRTALPPDWVADVALERAQALRWLTAPRGWDEVGRGLGVA